MHPDRRQFAPATARNRDFILPILQRVLPAAGTVLEVGSGTGEHAVHFARHLPALRWQPSDADPAALQSIAAWAAEAALPNLDEPLLLDLATEPWPLICADAVVAINVLHYSPWTTTAALFRGAAAALPAGGVVYCYGPYRRHGSHTAPSNAAFDDWLRGADPRFAVRDLEAVEAEAAQQGFRLEEIIDMPANNFSLVFRRNRARMNLSAGDWG
jgi:cyclopropane fatty-acyl-phospholipid synthase-like methyltransferase